MSATDRFVEHFGLMAQENGDSRIAGRIAGLLVAEGRELSLTQISEMLQVSRASVSTNARNLAKRGIIRIVSRAGDRQDYYELVTMPYVDALDQLAERFRRHADIMTTCVEELRAEKAPGAERAADIQDFLAKSAEILKDWAEQMHQDGSREKDAK